ncbi:MAG: tetratricopeptide repeat protein [Lachnospiraceae bacterium]|nr:tetratricopeptide repeat protein [Lachnospiraceae bacterium]MBQ4275323.1 tetratricopeptide repeat protein [Lachnospiraceae bacterium]
MIFCYNCGTALSEKSYCTSCGVSVKKYKKIIYMSNKFYNRGLEKAQIRDLTGAVEDLRQSLMCYKRNTQARNLLGLVYFEMGETINAMAEWVISQHYQSERNMAIDYIQTLQSNPTLLDSLNSTIKKYNSALNLCKQGSLDMAKITLKKVVSNNPKLINAHLLLALILMQEEDYQSAKKELILVRRLDKGNITAALYIRMADENLNTDSKKSKKKDENAITFQSGNDIIIQPKARKENTFLTMFINVAVGLVIGLLVGWFVLGPIRVNIQRADENKELADAYDEINLKNTTIDTLNNRIDSITNQYEAIQDQLNAYEGTNGAFEGYKYLLLAVSEYSKGDSMDKNQIAQYLDKIDENSSEKLKEEEFTSVYNMLKGAIGESVANSYYENGYNAFRQEDYVTALENFKKAVEYDKENVNALYYLACTYMANKDNENAKTYFNKVIELAPGTELSTKASNYINEIDAN